MHSDLVPAPGRRRGAALTVPTRSQVAGPAEMQQFAAAVLAQARLVGLGARTALETFVQFCSGNRFVRSHIQRYVSVRIVLLPNIPSTMQTTTTAAVNERTPPAPMGEMLAIKSLDAEATV